MVRLVLVFVAAFALVAASDQAQPTVEEIMNALLLRGRPLAGQDLSDANPVADSFEAGPEKLNEYDSGDAHYLQPEGADQSNAESSDFDASTSSDSRDVSSRDFPRDEDDKADQSNAESSDFDASTSSDPRDVSSSDSSRDADDKAMVEALSPMLRLTRKLFGGMRCPRFLMIHVRVRNPCEADLAQLCPDTVELFPGLACLHDNAASLNPACSALVANDPVYHCAPDILKFCQNVPMGDIGMCLTRSHDELDHQCAAYIETEIMHGSLPMKASLLRNQDGDSILNHDSEESPKEMLLIAVVASGLFVLLLASISVGLLHVARDKPIPIEGTSHATAPNANYQRLVDESVESVTAL